MFLIFLLFSACEKLHVRPSDTIAIVFCGSQKSLTTGMLLITRRGKADPLRI
jgi:predicted Na+-dependent transporter